MNVGLFFDKGSTYIYTNTNQGISLDMNTVDNFFKNKQILEN